MVRVRSAVQIRSRAPYYEGRYESICLCFNRLESLFGVFAGCVLVAWLLRFAIAVLGGSHSAARAVIRCLGSFLAKAVALVVEKSLSSLHN